MNLDLFGGRKFLLTVGTYFGNGLLLWFGKVDPLIWRDAFIATVGAFLAANVYEKVKGVGAPPA